ncbi:helix-turn-helix domain-containing protein [Streptacidiphilus melanogenes]|uniref:helix-turn-helix domain-containing protein n=1 Tax=Streptacidiphilus melanogenes TaxID=411235 RepID=UPI0005AAB321|nr:XRE family transcriptional regulator [Streptacidiphilus melanogenes]
MDESVSGRVREVIRAAGMSQAAFAARAGITPDKLSKSLGGVRRFSSLDLALIAETAEVSVDWLLTGRQHAPAGVAARGDAVAHGRSLTESAERFTAAYDVLELLGRAPALPELPTLSRGGPDEQGESLAAEAHARVPAAAGAEAALLPTGDLLSVLEHAFGVDFAVTELPAAVDGFAWQEDGFRLALARRDERWTRQRFTLAHELGHLLAGDAAEPLAESPVAPGRQAEPDEVRANAFAAALLMPGPEVRAAAAVLDFAELVVRFRVSPSALAARLRRLGLVDAAEHARLRRRTTAECHLAAGAMDAYLREAALAAAERPPARLADGLWSAFEAGETTLRPLAALLGMEPRELEGRLAASETGPNPSEPRADEGELIYQP